jgi:hypothetical protein
MSSIPGPLNQVHNPVVVDKGTLSVRRSRPPVPQGIASHANPVRPRWNSSTIAAYRELITDEGLNLAQTKEEFDCADWAFALLIRYAREHGLPLKFHKVGSGPVGSLRQWYGERDDIQAGRRSYDPMFPESSASVASAYNEYFTLEAWVRNEMGARDLILTGFDNALPVTSIDELLPGDILALASGEHRHIQLVLANETPIEVWDDVTKTKSSTQVLDILQGNMPAQIIQRCAWDLLNGQYYRYDWKKGIWQVEKDTPGDIRKLWNGVIFGRRWNFDRFNEAYK